MFAKLKIPLRKADEHSIEASWPRIGELLKTDLCWFNAFH
jgi:hypothetical protein